MEIPSDFNLPWCKAILSSNISNLENSAAVVHRPDNPVSNSMFGQTLYTPTAIRAQLSFRRPTSEPDSIKPWENCFLLSIGSGIDGKTGRAHGGFNSLILDQMTGMTASLVSASEAPATATMTVDYKAPIDTPGVILVRGWPVERQGRKTWVRARIEDGEGKLLAGGKALFIDARPVKL
ncbi:hypothetical protein H2200_013160 [Cladophialophora chaetospira]|uniref:Thioesterase domain-containing protein n=1 Tax=Cladophialophora chaetospira TaxID=386627 RepID=A0AA38WW93_9EURO|nr:hypothetical protein H2200_013160 [Cladophialophora chaetospira]